MVNFVSWRRGTRGAMEEQNHEPSEYDHRCPIIYRAHAFLPRAAKAPLYEVAEYNAISFRSFDADRSVNHREKRLKDAG